MTDAASPHDLAAELSRLAAADAGISVPDPHRGDALSDEDLLRLAERLGSVAAQAHALQAQAVVAARERGASWAQVGSALGTSPQAAQQRFGSPQPEAQGERRVPRPTAPQELDTLNALGAEGWWLTGAQSDTFTLEQRDVPCEVRIASLFSVRMPSQRSGWIAVALRFPTGYYARPL